MNMRRTAWLLAAVAGLAVPALRAAPAVADCSGPTIEYDAGPVDPGSVITVRGTAWGDNCYDTGQPPPGQGALGRPVSGIVISVVQGEQIVIVAEGSADADYGFEVSFVIPGRLEPGEAHLVAEADGPLVFDATDRPLVISAEPGSDLVDGIVRFGPGSATPPTTTSPIAVTSIDSAAADPSVSSRSSFTTASSSSSTTPLPLAPGGSATEPDADEPADGSTRALGAAAVAVALSGLVIAVILRHRRQASADDT